MGVWVSRAATQEAGIWDQVLQQGLVLVPVRMGFGRRGDVRTGGEERGERIETHGSSLRLLWGWGGDFGVWVWVWV